MGKRAPKRRYPIQMVRPMTHERLVMAMLSPTGKFTDLRPNPKNVNIGGITLQHWVVCSYNRQVILYPPAVDSEPWNGGVEYPDSDAAVAAMRMCANG